MTYEEQLQDPRWIYLRDYIIERDWRVCQICMSGKNLEVHHKVYIKNRMAWDYADDYLITVCRKCHEHIHATTEIKVLEHGDPLIEAFGRMAENFRLLSGLMKKMNGK